MTTIPHYSKYNIDFISKTITRRAYIDQSGHPRKPREMKPDRFQQYRLLSDDNVKCFITFPQLKELQQKG